MCRPMFVRPTFLASVVLLWVSSSCAVDDLASPTSTAARAADCTPDVFRVGAVTIYGRVLYDHAADTHSRPARRIQVEAVPPVSAPWSADYETYTNDNGCYALEIPFEEASEISQVRVSPISSVSDYETDGIGDENCNGASWVVQSGNAGWLHSFDPVITTGLATSVEVDVMVHPGDESQPVVPGDFSNIDIVLTSMETVCEGDPHADFGDILIEKSTGTSSYSPRLSRIRLQPTKYGDPETVAHEFFHHVQATMYGPRNDRDLVPGIFRSASHRATVSNLIDPRVAWREGAAEGFGHFIFKQYGFGLGLENDYSDNRTIVLNGIYKEWHVARTVYALIDGDGYGSFHSVYSTRFLRVPSFQTLHSFAYVYAASHDSTILDEWMAKGSMSPEGYEDAFDSQNVAGELNSSLSLYPNVAPEWRIEGPGSTTDVLAYSSGYIPFQEYNFISDGLTDNPAIGPYRSRWFRFRPERVEGRSDLYQGLTILDDDADCGHDLTLVVYEYEDAALHEVARESGCPIYIPLTGLPEEQYLIDVYATDLYEDVECFSFFDDEACSISTE